MTGIDRSPAMVLAAYFMAKFGEPSEDGRLLPPSELGVPSRAEAYRRLFPNLGTGRPAETFAKSIDQDRRHYLACLAGEKEDSEARKAILGPWVNAARADLWEQVRPHVG